MTTRQVEFIANPIQRAFIQSRAKADLFSSRMGEGKSAGLCWAIFYHTQHNPGARWCMIRDTWENLQATTLQEFFKWFPPGLAGNWHATQKRWTWGLDGLGNGTVDFLGMDDPVDATKLQSRELAGIAIDEPSPAAESGGVSELVFDIGLGRLRQPHMKWYAVKLAQNNPDESHWTFRKFVDPGTEGFRAWQTAEPENIRNLPPEYYEGLRVMWGHRPDLVRRFVEGKYGFQTIGQAVCPNFSEDLHVHLGLSPIKGKELLLCWDFGLTPTCHISQVKPSGHWDFFRSIVGEEMGVFELINDAIKPILAADFPKFALRHTGDPAGTHRDPSSSKTSPVKVIKRELGGPFIPGPTRWEPLRNSAQAALSKVNQGTGLVRIDREGCKALWYALRGGWHYNIARSGVISKLPVKDQHSHPGDAFAHGAALLFPSGKIMERKAARRAGQATYFGKKRKVPKEARKILAKKR